MDSGLLAIDTETTGVGWYDNAFMISIATEGGTQVYDNRYISVGEWNDILALVQSRLVDADKIIMHNAKFDIQKLCRLGIPLSVFKDKFEDTQAIAHLINEQQSTGLKYLAQKYLNETTDEDEAIKAYRRKNKLKKETGYEPIPYEILAPYACKDAEFTLALYKHLYPMLPADLHELYETEKRLTISLLGVEARGMRIDRSYVLQQRREYGDNIYTIKKRIADLAGEGFNPQSPQQVIAAMSARGITIDKTDKDTLSGLSDELASLIVSLRECNKIKTTYFDALWNETMDDILHPNFRQHGTRTGRMSSGAATN